MLARMWKSLQTRGITGSIDRAWSIVQESLFDLRYGLDTVTCVELRSLAIDHPSSAEGQDYQPTRMRPFQRVLAALPPPPGSAFVDYGSGKGRPLLLAARYGFKRIVGVEFSAKLCAVARENVARFQRSSGTTTSIEVFEGNAADYSVRPDENYFHFFNPFRASVMASVIRNISQSVVAADRQVFLIYKGPLETEIIMAREGFFPIRQLRQLAGDEITVYSNRMQRPAPAGRQPDDSPRALSRGGR